MLRGAEIAKAEVSDMTACVLAGLMTWVGRTVTSLIEAHGSSRNDAATGLGRARRWPASAAGRADHLRAVDRADATRRDIGHRPAAPTLVVESATRASTTTPRRRSPTCPRTKGRRSRRPATGTSGATPSASAASRRTSPATDAGWHRSRRPPTIAVEILAGRRPTIPGGQVNARRGGTSRMPRRARFSDGVDRRGRWRRPIERALSDRPASEQIADPAAWRRRRSACSSRRGRTAHDRGRPWRDERLAR